MKKLIWILAALFLLVCGILVYLGSDRGLREARHRVIAENSSHFQEHRSGYLAVISAWKALFNPYGICGVPPPGPGLVQFRVFELNDEGTYRVAIQSNDRVFPTDQAAAAALNIPAATIQLLAANLRSLGRGEVYQHDAEIRIPSANGAGNGILFVSPSCPQASQYERESKIGTDAFFVNLISIGNGWYYYSERR
jgi:hypothetical protein